MADPGPIWGRSVCSDAGAVGGRIEPEVRLDCGDVGSSRWVRGWRIDQCVEDPSAALPLSQAASARELAAVMSPLRLALARLARVPAPSAALRGPPLLRRGLRTTTALRREAGEPAAKPAPRQPDVDEREQAEQIAEKSKVSEKPPGQDRDIWLPIGHTSGGPALGTPHREDGATSLAAAHATASRGTAAAHQPKQSPKPMAHPIATFLSKRDRRSPWDGRPWGAVANL